MPKALEATYNLLGLFLRVIEGSEGGGGGGVTLESNISSTLYMTLGN